MEGKKKKVVFFFLSLLPKNQAKKTPKDIN